MESLIREATYNTPEIQFNASQGTLQFIGRSIPEHANNFYHELIEWATQYANGNPPATKVTVKLDYLNSSSHKFLFDVFEKLEPINANGIPIEIEWYYEMDDEEMKETGEEYQDTIKIPFKIIEVEEL